MYGAGGGGGGGGGGGTLACEGKGGRGVTKMTKNQRTKAAAAEKVVLTAKMK
mgnify:CR=1 FL=1